MRGSVTTHMGNFNFPLSFSNLLHQKHYYCLTLIVLIYIVSVGIYFISDFVCVQAVSFWKHWAWYTCAVFICKFINGSQFPVLIFLMFSQRKLNKPDAQMYTILGPFVLTKESCSIITLSISAFKSKS